MARVVRIRYYVLTALRIFVVNAILVHYISSVRSFTCEEAPIFRDNRQAVNGGRYGLVCTLK